jgi:hypothetical protein
MAHGITDALLIYNPTSGRRRRRRFVEIEQSVRVLKEAGIETELAPTTGPGTPKKSRGSPWSSIAECSSPAAATAPSMRSSTV